MNLSIVIPVYNEQRRLEETLVSTIKYAQKNFDAFEIILVDDGSTDNTLEVAEKFKNKNVRVLQNKKNMGKGYSVKQGILYATYPYTLFMDGDLATPIVEFEKFIPFLAHYDILIASRNLKESQKLVKQPFYRNLAGQVFPLLVRLFVLRGIYDTQCGFKLFKTSLAKKIVKLQTLHRWAFDVELLFIAKKMGLRLKEIPITWIDQPGSKVHFFRDSFQMLYDLFLIRYNNVRGLYRVK